MKLPLVVITGQTASGKTSLAIELAKKYNGEIICADSRTIYKGMNIGTAKPTKKEQSIVPHWGLDIIEPGEYFSAADFKIYADQKIDEIRSRHHIPLLVGGTGLYIDSVIFNYQFGNPVNSELRSKLQRMNLDQLQKHCINNEISLPENNKNIRYLIRAIENKGVKLDNSRKLIDSYIVVGISTENSDLKRRIVQRVENMFNDGVIDETRRLDEKYGWQNEAMKSNVYSVIKLYISDQINLDEAKERVIVADWHLAKRQMTWLKRNKFIHWLSLNDSEKYISDQLAKYKKS